MTANMLPWNDLQVVLAIARTGSLSGAKRQLGVSHATVFRRLGEIERRLGVELFHRSRKGYAPTSAGEDMAAAANRVEAEVLGLERRLAGRDLRPFGTVRITTTDTLLYGVLSPIFRDFRRRYPEIELDIAVSNYFFSLSRREAEVAIRPTRTPPETLVGRRVATLAQAVYGDSGEYGHGNKPPEFSACDWVGPDEGLMYDALEKWMLARKLDDRCRYRVNSLLGMHAAVRSGLGVAALPCYLCDGDPGLTRLSEPLPELDTQLWLLTHPDLRRVARVRALLDFVAAALKEEGARLEGR
jgi:DNA-binding transcriptional LysR family regulator